MSSHPLDNEDIVVKVTLVHRPTGAVAQFRVDAPCDADPSVAVATAQALEQAEDALLFLLESQGG